MEYRELTSLRRHRKNTNAWQRGYAMTVAIYGERMQQYNAKTPCAAFCQPSFSNANLFVPNWARLLNTNTDGASKKITVCY
jgi:hypothetical protein